MPIPSWIKPTLRDATLAYLGCTGIGALLIAGGISALRVAVQDGSRPTILFIVSSMLAALIMSQVAAFTLIARIRGGSRKSRSQYVRRVALQFWIIESIVRVGVIVALSIRPDWAGTVERAAQIKMVDVFGIFLSYLIVMGLSTLGRNLSFRFNPDPAEMY